MAVPQKQKHTTRWQWRIVLNSTNGRNYSLEAQQLKNTPWCVVPVLKAFKTKCIT